MLADARAGLTALLAELGTGAAPANASDRDRERYRGGGLSSPTGRPPGAPG